jgi:hypothetical protein
VRREFRKATVISVGAYAGALLVGFWIDFRLTLFSVLALQVTWTLFCVLRAIQLRLGGAHKPDAEAYAREDYGFTLGGTVSSLTLLGVIVVLTQIV